MTAPAINSKDARARAETFLKELPPRSVELVQVNEIDGCYDAADIDPADYFIFKIVDRARIGATRFLLVSKKSGEVHETRVGE
jgi:hypothetical protein